MVAETKPIELAALVHQSRAGLPHQYVLASILVNVSQRPLLTLIISVPLTDAVLKDEIGISKIGHRLRLLSQLRQDALAFFYEQCVANFNFDFNDLLMIRLNGHLAQQ